MKYFEVKRARIEIIPMIDIMFFLLVFFMMMTINMIPTTGVSSNLAKSSTATPMDTPKVLVTVNNAGVMTVDGRIIQAAQLTALLVSKVDISKIAVTIAAEKETPFQDMLKVMDACRLAGVSQIGLAARKDDGS
jgi:biopolymer transport protein ExbD